MARCHVGLIALIACLSLAGCCLSPPRDVTAHAGDYPGGYEIGVTYRIKKDTWLGEFSKDGAGTLKPRDGLGTPDLDASQFPVSSGTRFRVVKLMSVCWNTMPGYYYHLIIPMAVIEDGPHAGIWADIWPISRMSFKAGDAHEIRILGPDPEAVEMIAR